MGTAGTPQPSQSVNTDLLNNGPGGGSVQPQQTQTDQSQQTQTPTQTQSTQPVNTDMLNRGPGGGAISSPPQMKAMISPDGKKTKLVPANQIEDAQGAGWEEAYKMQGETRNGLQVQTTKKWVPKSQVASASDHGWRIVPQTEEEKQNEQGVQNAATKDAAKTDNLGNAAILAAPAVGLPAAVESTFNAGYDAVGAAVNGLGRGAVQKLAEMGGKTYLSQDMAVKAGQEILKKALTNPTLWKTIGGSAAGGAVLHWLAKHGGVE